MNAASIIHVLLALALAPLLPGIINRTKARVAGRRGQPVLQLYYDLAKLLRKGAVYSRTTTWVFRAGPTVGLAAVLVALGTVPLGGAAGLVSFEGDLLLFAYALGLARFFTVLAALDTGSAFEGMGASREVTYSALVEPALLLGLAALARQAGSLSLAGIYAAVSPEMLMVRGGAAALLVAAAFFIVMLAENARIPVDDPNTHLELTMIHEVMVLDHGGPDFAFIQYASALKLWILGALFVGVVVPVRGDGFVSGAAALGGLAAVAVTVGVIESVMARLRLVRVPQLLAAATVLAILALVVGAFMGRFDTAVVVAGGVPQSCDTSPKVVTLSERSEEKGLAVAVAVRQANDNSNGHSEIPPPRCARVGMTTFGCSAQDRPAVAGGLPCP